MKLSEKTKLPSFKKPSPEVTERMKRVKSRGTRLEIAMENILKGHKIKYESQPNMYGHPDFKISSFDILIFCDSSFWHGRRKKDLNGKTFKRNPNFWTAKIIYNRNRDLRINRKLRREGWSVLRFWDDDILKNQDKVVRRIKRKIDEKCQ